MSSVELNRWFIEKNAHVKSCLYLIDTGLCDGQDTIFKYGRTTDIQQRMARHMKMWKNMKILHIEPVLDSVNCEKCLKEALREYIYTTSFMKQKELLYGRSPRVFIDCIVEIAQKEMEQVKVYQEALARTEEFRNQCSVVGKYSVSPEYLKQTEELLNGSNICSSMGEADARVTSPYF